MMHRLLVIAYAVLFALGVALFPLTLRTTPLSDILLMIVCLGLLAGFVEAIAVAYTGKRRWIWAWLPPVVGIVAFFEIAVARDILLGVDPQDPDGPYALVVFPFMALGYSMPFALLVHGWATCLLWLGRSRVWPTRSLSN